MTGRDQAHRLTPSEGCPGGARRRRARDEGGGVLLKLAVLIVVVRARRRCGRPAGLDRRRPGRFRHVRSPRPPDRLRGAASLRSGARPGRARAGACGASGGPLRRSGAASRLSRRSSTRRCATRPWVGISASSSSDSVRRKPAYTVDGDGVVTPASTLKLLTSVRGARRARAGPPIRHDGRDRREQALDRAGRRRRPAAHRAGADACRGRGELSGAGVACRTWPARPPSASRRGVSGRWLCRTTSRSTPAPPSTRTGRPTTSPTTWSAPSSPLWVDEGREVDGLRGAVRGSGGGGGDEVRRLPRQVRRQGHRLGGRTHGAAQGPRARGGAVGAARAGRAARARGQRQRGRRDLAAPGRDRRRQAGVVQRRGRGREEPARGARRRAGNGSRIYDGSGLARDDEVPVQTLVDVLQVAADPQHPTLRPVVSTLPVAGFTGSLAYRFVTDAPAGLGVVRAKTGTLTAAGVHGLAGIVDDEERHAAALRGGRRPGAAAQDPGRPRPARRDRRPARHLRLLTPVDPQVLAR